MIKETKIDSLQVKIYQDRIEMGANAAALVADKIRSLLFQKENVNVIFAAAPSQNEFLQFLCEEREVEWNRVNVFHMDEYIGLDRSAEQSFGNFLRNKIFDKIPFCSINYIDGNADNLLDECKRYSDLLELYPADIVCMGIGENTHIAFNDPHLADFNDMQLVKVADLDEACRQQQVNDGCFATLNEVPLFAITLTIPALLRARNIYCMVPGGNKAQAVYYTLKEKISEDYPSTIIRKHHNSIMFLDRDSSKKIIDEIPLS
ncbi:MAG: glucosamine-6-phosphate deaminase [Calditrichaeota bacterium]|nr:glucosamine-6-phosphate deaminase [Calditrichota bacterium]